MKYREIEGDLIQLALEGKFDVIAHGCNCFCKQESGIAKQMSKVFHTAIDDRNWFSLENKKYKGNINKLGSIQMIPIFLYKNEHNYIAIYNHNITSISNYETLNKGHNNGGYIVKEVLYVVNAYTQFMYGTNHKDGVNNPLDYEALTLCMRKINYTSKGKHIGLPKIGAGLARGDWGKIKEIIQKELKDCNVTVVLYKSDKNDI